MASVTVTPRLWLAVLLLIISQPVSVTAALATCSRLVGASLSWSLQTSSTDRIVSVFLRTAFDVSACTLCAFEIGKPPVNTIAGKQCEEFGNVCFRINPESYGQCNLDVAATCDNPASNNNMIVIAYFGDATTDPSGSWQTQTASIGVSKFVTGELVVNYTLPTSTTSAPNFLETWYSFSEGVVVVPKYRTVIPFNNLKNFYSPVPMLPLFVPVPYNGYQFKYKAFDFDGHPMIIEIDSDNLVSASIEKTRNITVKKCCQCPSPQHDNDRIAFFDLATDPHDFIGASPNLGWDGPIITNSSQRITTTIDTLPTRSYSVSDFQRVRTLDAVFDAIWNSPSKPQAVEALAQSGASSTTVETFFQTTQNPSTCGADNTPRFLLPVITEYTCPYDQIGKIGTACNEIELLVNGSSDAQPARIIPAVGFPSFDYQWVESESATEGSLLFNVLANAGSAAQICSKCSKNEIYSRQRCPCFCPEAQYSQKRCWYKVPKKSLQDVGTFIVQCFMAVRRRGSSAADSCYSAPLCIKIYIAGNKPSFVDPTPLAANSENDNGVLIQGRTDVPACLGYPMQLQLKALDADFGDYVRIFVRDIEGIFFKGADLSFDTTECRSGIVQPYNAERSGDNENQTDDYAIGSEVGSIAAVFRPEIQFSSGSAVQYVRYSLGPENGFLGQPKPKLNRNAIICGRAYDASRSRYGRWVGKRYDNKDTDYSFGDYRSDEHCWRVNLQAPPKIKSATVASSKTVYTQSGGFYTVPAGTGDSLDVVITAEDTNARDRTQMLLLGTTGLPVGASIASTSCNATTFCSTVDTAQSAASSLLARNVDSDCSSVNFKITWSVSTEDVGKTIKICAVPRDSSTVCVGKGPTDASAMGWFGQPECLNFNVTAPHFAWKDHDEFRSYDVFVGCVFTFKTELIQSTQGYDAEVQLASAPDGAKLVNDNGETVGSRLGTVSWIPSRGTEGQFFEFCIIGSVPGVSQTSSRCFETFVAKCRYCVENPVLNTVRSTYNIDTNWIRLWSLNADNSSELGLKSVCIPQLDCNNADNAVVMSNPDLSVTTFGNKAIIWAGTIFKSSKQQTLVEIAGRFHTTVKSLLSVNPELKAANIEPSIEICTIPCNQS